MTYSIAARDPGTGLLGVAVQSHFLAVGRNVPYGRPGIGIVATQANVRAEYGPDGLARMAAGLPAAEALVACLADDPAPDVRQAGFVDAAGRAAAHTGSGCWRQAAHHTVDGATAQANMVHDAAIPHAMIEAYLAAEGTFAGRLLGALDAAESLGGDLRGRQSAALYIISGDPAATDNGVLVDLRVDNHADPLGELAGALRVHEAFVPLWDVIRGPACRGSQRPTPDETALALRVLRHAQVGYGPGNLEPTFWHAVALWRSGRRSEAELEISHIAEDNPGWRLLFTDVASR